MAKKYLDLLGLTAYDGKIKDYAEDVAETEASNAVSNHNNDVNAHSTLLNGYVPTTRTIAGNPLTANISAAELTAALSEATQSLKGLLSYADKKKIDDLWAIFDNGNESFVDTLTEIMEIFQNYPEGADLVTQLATKADKATTYTKTEVDNIANTKVDNVTGKGLSTNDYTTTEKTKLTGIDAGAQVNTVASVAGKTGAVTLAKADVGLGSVQNYDVATQAQAEAGTASDLYMTPIRTKQAIEKLADITESITETEINSLFV